MKCYLRKHFSVVLLAVGVCLVLPGCSGAQKMIPHMGFGSLNIEAEIARSDIVVMDRVEGSSTLDTYFFGAVMIIDGDKLQLFGIKLFKDKYVWRNQGPTLIPAAASAASRAYYKALEAHPDADAVFAKAWEREEAGIPFLFHNLTVTFKGKAIRLLADR